MPSSSTAAIFRWLVGLTALGVAVTPLGAQELPLHDRVDALVEAANPGLIAPAAGDADFLRRLYLDLAGVIPPAPVVRAFLDDPSPNKRTAMIDALLVGPRFSRHMQYVFDSMWMERRADKVVKSDEWREYLRQSFATNKPLDQLAREILSADGVDPNMRAAARFYLDRDGDANLVARDVGRLFFGRDLQCAQCHDHPLVDDYRQSEYYGLLAFVNRGTLFTDKDQKIFYAETADGEVNYKSVFTGDARERVVPKIPDGAPVNEPLLAKEEQYVVAPAKGVRPVPKYSRRAQLAAAAASGTSAAFNRNLANRLWAHMMGRGLVHPLDMNHSGNPPVQSQLLALLGDELPRTKFNLRGFLRELALTRAYQRSSEMPSGGTMPKDSPARAATVAAWQVEVQRLAGELDAMKSADAEAIAALGAAHEKFATASAARDAADKARAEAKKSADDAAAAVAAAIKDIASKEDVLKPLLEARDKAKVAAGKLPDDKALAEAAGQLATKALSVETELTAARKTVSDQTAAMQAATLKVGEHQRTLDAAAAVVTSTRAAVEAADLASRSAADKLRGAKARHNELASRITDVQAAIDYQHLASAVAASQLSTRAAVEQLSSLKSQTSNTSDALAAAEAAAVAAAEKVKQDQAAADVALAALADRSTNRFTLAPLKSLSPEQLAWSTMQSLGMVDAQVAALAPQAKKDADAIANLTPDARAAAEAGLLEARVDEKLRGNIGSFVSLFGQQPGQAASFQATVHQALFLSNGGLLAGWLNPGGNNLTERLSKIENPAVVADELYVSVMSRRPATDEQAEVARYWEAAKADRVTAAREMVWSLVTSAEFRFNH
jgi:hypothetical protein